jgi:hypothetical protein
MQYRPHSPQRGTSLAELMIALAAAAGIVAATMLFFGESNLGLMRGEAAVDLLQWSQRASSNLRKSVAECQRLFAPNRMKGWCVAVTYTADATDLGYANLLAASISSHANAAKEATFSTLPKLYIGDESTGVYEQPMPLSDSSKCLFGNALAFAAALPPLRLMVSDGSNTNEMQLDFLQFRKVYLSRSTGGAKLRTLGDRLVLMEWRSIAYPNLRSIQMLPSNAQSHVVSQLLALGFTRAWDPTADAPTAFWDLQNTSPILKQVTSTPSTLPTQSWSDMANMAYTFIDRPSSKANRGPIIGWGVLEGVTGYRNAYSIAYNTKDASTALKADGILSMRGPLTVPSIAQASNGPDGFPGGFEVMLTGSPFGMEVDVVMTLMSSINPPMPNSKKAPMGLKTYSGLRAEIKIPVRDSY